MDRRSRMEVGVSNRNIPFVENSTTLRFETETRESPVNEKQKTKS